MKREKAIEAMDLLAGQGYTVTLHAQPMPPGMLDHKADDGIRYSIEVRALGFDSVDLRHLCDAADTLGLVAGTSRMSPGAIEFSEPSQWPEVVRTPRRHPR